MNINEMSALGDVLQPIDLRLENIFLDPNNPRFVDDETRLVDTARITEPGVQQLALEKLISEFGVEKLAGSMRVNGFLPIDRIVLKKLTTPEDSYVVLEGNRRIAAAKLLAKSIADDPTQVSESVTRSLQSIPCLEYIGADIDAAWIFQGLRHITGISEWPAYNKARLLVEQMEREGLTLTQAGERFGLTAYGAGQWARGYYAYQQALEESDYVHEVHVHAYPYFQELFGRSCAPLKEWLEWKEDAKRFDNLMNYNEFIGWLYPRVNEDDRPDEYGKFDRRYIRTRDDLRQLSYMRSEAAELFEKFRREKDVERAYAEAMARKYERESANSERSLFDSVLHCKRALENVPYRFMQNSEFRGRLHQALQEISISIASLGLGETGE
jgi:hypothetical protein